MAVAGLVVAALLGGCSDVNGTEQLIEPKDTTRKQHMTPEEARTDLWSRLDAIEVVLGGSRDHEDSEVALGCDIEDDSGFYYGSGRFRKEPIADYDTAAKTLVEYLRAQGYAVDMRSYAPTHRGIAAVAANGTEIDIEMEAGVTRIQAEGPCNEGNWAEVSDEDAKRVDEQQRSATPTPPSSPGR